MPKFGQDRKLVEHKQLIYKLIYTSTGLLISNSDDARIILWDSVTCEKVQELQHENSMFAMGLTKDEKQLISCTDNNKMIIWNMETYQRDKEIDIEENAAIRALLISPDGTCLITGDMAARIVIWNLSTFDIKKIYRTHKNSVWALAYYEKTNLLFSGDDDGKILIHNLATEIFLTALTGHLDRILSLEVSRDGEILISGCRDCSVKI